MNKCFMVKERSTILINTPPYTETSAGCRVLHYLAALLRAAKVPVATTCPCFYDPTIEVRSEALPDDIGVIPEAHLGNPINAKRIVRYVLYFQSIYGGGDRIPEEDCAIIYHRAYFEDAKALCDHPLVDEDIITIPILDATWCFPEPGKSGSVFYSGKGTFKAPDDAEPIGDGGHMATLAKLRRAENFYTADAHTLMSLEAKLCGCKVFYPVRDKWMDQLDLVEEAIAQKMSPRNDIIRAERFASRVYKFFGQE